MIFAGIQKLTLLDDPAHVACTLFTQGCGFRCPFCHNSDLLDFQKQPKPCYTEEYILDFLSKRHGILDSVCITGGEPLMQPQLFPFLEKVKEAGFSVKLDTNGQFPDRLKEAVHRGVIDRVAMDIKNCPEKYPLTTGVDKLDFDKIQESVAFLLDGAISFEFRTTVVAQLHTKNDMKKIGEWLCGDEKYYLQGYVDSENVLCKGLNAAPKEEMEEFRNILLPYIPNTQLRGV